ncbi:MAG: dihydroorotase [Rhodoluna sp.]|nr:dihydroorotase [Rhodoluna sp.]
MSRFVLQGATVPDGTIQDVLVDDGVIREIASGLNAEDVIDCKGLQLLPGFVDMHTHLREPGFEASETVLTGTQSAALGGFTAVHAMANTSPVADNAAVVEMIRNLGDRAGYVEVFPIGAVTRGLEGKALADFNLMNQSTAKVKVFSDDGKCVSDALLMRRALEYTKSFGGVIAQHAQEPTLTENAQMNEGELSAVLGLKGWPAMAEETIIARDVLLAEHTSGRLHICHLSTAGSVEIIRWAKARGISVTAEVTPHHLLLTEQLAKDYNPIFKVNPPLRTESDVMALREALIDGTIDIIATDHAPHPSEAKDCEWAAAAFGMVGLETAASVAQLVLIESKRSSWQRMAEVLSHAPAAIAGDEGQGLTIEVGNPANLTLIDPSAIRTISSATASKSLNNPYAGLELPGSVVHTIYRGRFTVRDSSIVEKTSA